MPSFWVSRLWPVVPPAVTVWWVSLSTGQELCVGTTDAVPSLHYPPAGVPHGCWLPVRYPHIIMASGASHLCTRWFIEQLSPDLGDSYYANFFIHLPLAYLRKLCKARDVSRALRSWNSVVFLNCWRRGGLGGTSESSVIQLLCSLNWEPAQILNCFLN